MKNIKMCILLVTILVLGSIAPMHTEAQQDIKVIVDGENVCFDQAPVIENDRTLVPFRAIFEALGAEVSWDENLQLVTSKTGSDTICLKIGEKAITKNFNTINIDVAPKIINDRTFVPVRAISECLNADVDWLAWLRTVVITTNKENPMPTSTPDKIETPVSTPTPTATPSQTPDKPETTPVPTIKPTLAPTAAPIATSTVNSSSDVERRVFELVNEERAKNGLQALVWNEDLANVARKHSQDMSDRNFFSHTNPDGLSPFDRMKNYGLKYTRAAENIAAGQTTPEKVMESWMNSSGHRANILNPELTQIGVGYYKGSRGYSVYWTQCFMTP